MLIVTMRCITTLTLILLVYYRQKSNTSVIHIIVANYKHLSQSCQQSRYLGKKQGDKDADLQKS